MAQQNLALMYKKVPSGLPKPGEDIAIEDISSRSSPSADPAEGGVVVKVLYASLDPYLRGLLRPKEVSSYMPALDTDTPIRNGAIAKVIKASSSSGYQEGDLVQSQLPIQQFVSLSSEQTSKLTRLDTADGPDDIRHYLGALGMPGLTAYSSFYDIGRPTRGETVFISSAAGAVGQVVGQIAKHEGLTVLGSVGSDEKLAYLTDELGFDGGFNYKTEKPADALKRLAPKGVDIYFENVGGEQLEAAIDAMNQHGRIVACGMISEYNVAPEQRFPHRNLMSFVAKRLTMRGFLVNDKDMGPKYAADHQKNLRKWLKNGDFKAGLHEWSIEEGDKAFVGMLKGENFGKALLKLSGSS